MAMGKQKGGKGGNGKKFSGAKKTSGKGKASHFKSNEKSRELFGKLQREVMEFGFFLSNLSLPFSFSV